MFSLKFLLSWACALSLLVVACSGSNQTYFASDERAVQKSLGPEHQPDPHVPRPQVGMPPADLNNLTWIEPFATELTQCGAVRHDLYGGDEYIIETENYPNLPSVGEKCSWNFNVQPNVAVDALCEQMQLPCEGRHYLRIRQYDPRVNIRICTDPADTIFVNQRIDGIPVRSVTYRLRFRHTVNNDPALQRGIGFRCVVRGTGGTIRPNPTPMPTVPPTNPPPTDPPAATCGIDASARKDSKIIGGNEATPHEYPWQIALRIGNSFCGGSIINSRWILTAAHCIAGGNSGTTFVYTGCHLRYSSCDPARAVNLLVIDARYNGNIVNDIGLVRLATPIASFNDRVQPICLPTASTPVGSTLWVSGWGKTSDTSGTSGVLKEASVIIQSDQFCRNVYGSIINDFAHMCATRGSGSTCNGDSGSFIGNIRNGVWEQDAIVSFGAAASCSGFPMGFTELRNYVDWVLRAMAAFP